MLLQERKAGNFILCERPQLRVLNCITTGDDLPNAGGYLTTCLVAGWLCHPGMNVPCYLAEHFRISLYCVLICGHRSNRINTGKGEQIKKIRQPHMKE